MRPDSFKRLDTVKISALYSYINLLLTYLLTYLHLCASVSKQYKLGTGRKMVMFFGWKGDHWPGRK